MLAQRSGDLRRSSRAIALQALYEGDVAAHPAEEAVQWIREEGTLPDEAFPFALELIRGVVKNRDNIDELIQRFAPTWPVRHLPAIDRNILRLALYEVTFDSEVPHKAAINEAVELAKTFGSESSSRFVNGVLGTVMEELEAGLQSSLCGAAGTAETEAR